jgi:signal transduction histidine kinase
MQRSRPIATDLSWLVLASLVPAAWVAAALAAASYAPSSQHALMLVAGVIALMVGASISILIASDLRRALNDIAADTKLLSRSLPMARLTPAVREFAAIADGLAAIVQRVAQTSADEDKAAAPAQRKIFNATAILNAVATEAGLLAAAAGIAFAYHAPAGVRLACGDGAALEGALTRIVENALTVTPRGGRITLEAHPDASGGLSITLARTLANAPTGIEIARPLVELNCGATGARRIEEARGLVVAAGGQFSTTPIAHGESMTITVASAPLAKAA